MKVLGNALGSKSRTFRDLALDTESLIIQSLFFNNKWIFLCTMVIFLYFSDVKEDIRILSGLYHCYFIR